MHSRLVFCVLLVGYVLTSCQERSKYTDTPTSGSIAISADESFQPIIDAEVEAFMASYKYAKVKPIYASEDVAIALMLNDSTRFAVVSRNLTDKERKVFEDQKIKPRIVKIATDAVALIVNKKNPDSLLTMQELTQIFSGEADTWKKINNNNFDQKIMIVFDQSNSSNLNYIQQKFKLADTRKINIFALKSNKEVIEYVEKNKNALGVIGVAWISDSGDNPAQQSFIDRVQVVGISEKENQEGKHEYYQPYAAYLALKKYPLFREVFIISKEARAGLGSGFMSYIASDKGQRIILKLGLLPATMPVRLVQLNTKDLDI